MSHYTNKYAGITQKASAKWQHGAHFGISIRLQQIDSVAARYYLFKTIEMAII